MASTNESYGIHLTDPELKEKLELVKGPDQSLTEFIEQIIEYAAAGYAQVREQSQQTVELEKKLESIRRKHVKVRKRG